MDNSSRNNKLSQLHSSIKQRRSGYEPSDTESEWQETPWHGNHQQAGALITEMPNPASVLGRNLSPLSRSQMHLLKSDFEVSAPRKASQTSPIPRRNSRSPYKPRTDDHGAVSPKQSSHRRTNSRSPYKLRIDDYDSVSLKLNSHPRTNSIPYGASNRRRHTSPYEARREAADAERNELTGMNRKRNQMIPNKFLDAEENGSHSQLGTSGVGERSNYSRRSKSVPKLKVWEKEDQISPVSRERRGDRSPSPLGRSMLRKQRESGYVEPSPVSEINEIIANAKLLRSPIHDALNIESTESIPPGDIFFSRDYEALKKNAAPKAGGFESNFHPKPKVASEINNVVQHRSRGIGGYSQNGRAAATSSVLSRTNTSSSFAVSRQSSSQTNNFSKMSDGTGKMSGSFRKFTENRQRNQKDTWFSCMTAGTCRKSKSPETREIDEASFIEKAFVVENLRQFWAEKHRPSSLSGFICHKSQAQHLRQLISHKNCPHMLFKGPSGSGRKELVMALLRDIYGSSAWKISHELRYFHVQEPQEMQVVVPLSSSPHHVELNLKTSSKNARYALMALVKEIASSPTSIPDISELGLKPDYKVIVLYEVDKLADNVQHLLKWIMDSYTDACKIILCCEDDTNLLESVKSRCKLITVDAPVTHEIMEVLIHIARKENFDLPMSFAAKIATKSKQNLRKAIMALEACKAHNYPFIDEQPIPLGWEEILMEMAAEILADPSRKRIISTRGKFQTLLVDFVHPKLILQKLVEEFLKGVENSSKRELYYWHAYYDKRLPTGTSALLKLEEFIAKFVSMHRKSLSGRFA